MERTNRFSRGTLVIAALCAIAAPASARTNTAPKAIIADNASSPDLVDHTGAATEQLPGGQSPNDNEICTCVATYSDGTSSDVDECSRSECPDLDRYNECRDGDNVLPAGGCRLLESCECDCKSTELVTYEYYGQDVSLAGVPNLWQFDYACGAFGTNAVGCGPVAATMAMYWWAQQGYEGLVDGFLSGAGSGPADRQHDWQAMVETFRDDYHDGGICVADQYATLQGTMRDGIDEFIADAGYSASVEHYKVCADCNLNESGEITSSTGIDIIKDELRAGRPVIMGFNVGRALCMTTTLDTDDGGTFETYSGELSNGTPALGIISHYAIITGYREIDGQDVLILNMGWEDDEDVAFLWNPAGPWLHLYTIDFDSAADGDEFCVIDRGLSDTFLDSADLDISNNLGTTPETVLAGTSCGILRDVTEGSYYPEWSGADFERDPFAEIKDLAESLDETIFHDGAATDAHGRPLQSSGGAPILDQIPPPGL